MGKLNFKDFFSSEPITAFVELESINIVPLKLPSVIPQIFTSKFLNQFLHLNPLRVVELYLLKEIN